MNAHRVNHDEALKILNTLTSEELYALADELRTHFLGNKLDTCMIMNAKSGKCSENCKWCSQSVFHKSKVDVYDLVDDDEVFTQAKVANDKGVAMFSLVTSGRKLSPANVKRASAAIAKAKEKYPAVGYCASMGLLNKAELQALHDAGVRRYHCNIETAPSYFPQLCSTHTQEEKMQTIAWAREVGLEVCSGGIIGMGETMEQRIEMALYLQKHDIRSIPLNILIPIAGTGMEGTPPLSDDEILTTFALFRIINPEADIRIAGGRVRIKHIQDKALKCGLSASMVGDLLTTGGLEIDEDMKRFRELKYTL